MYYIGCGDDRNEFFFKPRLHLYPENHLSVYDRWGAVAYHRRNYENDWNANDLPGGIYYYTLRLDRNNSTLKGWIQVVR